MALILVRLPLKWDNRIDAKQNPAVNLDRVGILAGRSTLSHLKRHFRQSCTSKLMCRKNWQAPRLIDKRLI